MAPRAQLSRSESSRRHARERWDSRPRCASFSYPLTTRTDWSCCSRTDSDGVAYGSAYASYDIAYGGDKPNLEDLRSHCGELIAYFKLPERLAIVDHIPYSSTGKVNRSQLAALIADDG